MNWKEPLEKLSANVHKDDIIVQSYPIKKIDESMCHYCGGAYSKLYNVYNDKNITKACIFCSKVVDYKNEDITSVVICRSDLSQLEIIKRTVDYFYENDVIPKIKVIDEKARLLNVSAYLYFKICGNKDSSFKYDKFRVFFTNTVDRNSIVKRNILSSSYPIQNIDLKYFNIRKYKLQDDQIEILEKFKRSEGEKTSLIIKEMKDRFIHNS